MSIPSRLWVIAASVFFAGCQQSVPINENDNFPYIDQAAYHQPIINIYHNLHTNNPGYFPGGCHFNGGYYSMRGYRK